MMKRLAIALLALGGLALGLVLVEALARAASAPNKSYMIPDPVLHHRLRPTMRRVVLGTEFATNSLGLRDREYPAAKPPGVRRLLMLGDSFTEGGGLLELGTVARQAEILIRDHCGRGWEVVNAGVASYSPILEYLQLREIGWALSPDVVVLNFDMTDVHDDSVRTVFARLDARGLPVAVPSDRRAEAAFLMPPIGKPGWLAFLTPVERWLGRSKLYTELRESRVGERLFGGVKLTPERLEALGLVGDIRYDVDAITRDVEHPSEPAAWALTARYLGAINAEARRRGVPFVVVVYPHAQQVSATASPEGRRRIGIGPGLYASERPFRRLEAIGRREGFPVVSLLGLFREREVSRGPLFRDDDIHHTEVGAYVFAEGIVAGLAGARVLECRHVLGR
ncbi:MAG: SGNH/GDSL hydrolase family protein [Candidatus Rokubacteria bacterium]|nr:SGNH/GDSL hydrolase family protein [Candidatus Rokubacteria bacterium]